MIKTLLSIYIFCISFFAFSQGRQNNTNTLPQLSGKIESDQGEAIPFANIVIYKVSDSSLVKGDASDLDGNFSINLKPGNYAVRFSFISYKDKTIRIEHGKNGSDLGTVQLQLNSEMIDEVQVVAEKSQMKLKLDKRVFNVGKDLSNAGTNAAEILDNIPSVAVDIEGNISLRGSQNVRVLIDGKPSTITGGSTADVLRQFQGNMIERVEVITNPSARYDAEGEVGIINIILKKEKKEGTNGSIEAVAGYPDNYRLSFNLNFRKKKYNLFTSYGTGYRKSPGGGTTFQSFKNQDTSYVFESTNNRSRASLNHNIRLGGDYYINPKNTITVAGFYRYSDEKNITKYEFNDLDGNGELFQQVNRDDFEDEYGNGFEGSLNYRKTFKKKEQLFTIDLQWSESDDLEKSNIEEVSNLSEILTIQNTRNLEANRNLLFQSDFILPFKKEGKFETGIRGNLRTIENNFKVEQSNAAGGFDILPEFFNDFVYNESIYAGYVMVGNKVNNFSYQLGIRGELSEISTELKRTDEKNKWIYNNLFPSAHFSYELKNKNSFQLSYSKRISRPRYRYLLPFMTFSNQRNLYRGNPDLQPEFTDSYELGYLNYFEKGSIFSSIYFRHRTGVIERITVPNNEGLTELIPVNLSTQDNFGLELTGNYKFSKKTNVNSSFNLFRSITNGSFDEFNLDNDVITWSNRTMFKTSLTKKIDFQSSFNYRAPQKTGQGRRKSIYNIDLSASKDLMKGKATLVASVRDLFNTRKRRSITETEELFSESEFQWRARQFLLSFTYRINEKKKRGGKPSGGFGGDDF